MFRLRGLHFSTVARLLRLAPAEPTNVPLHVLLCVADHYEPKWAAAPPHVQQERVDRWVREYPSMAAGLEDSRGRPPQHTYFYPAEEYEPEYLDQLAGLCRQPEGRQGLGDIEIHLHHDRDTSAGFREKIETFKQRLFFAHGLLSQDAEGRIGYGFIHGNWALDNSRPDGRWCGVNDEITILRETGCYADFTMPSAPDPAQTRTVNSIYYAVDDPQKPNSHDRGTVAAVGSAPPKKSLLMIQGPLALDWQRRKWGLLPGLENGDLTARRPPSWSRFDLWRRAGVSVVGQPNWVFIKLHTHGAQEANSAMLLGEPMRAFHQALADHARQNPWFRYYYVTAREMACLAHQAEQGLAAPAFDMLAAPAQ